MSIANVSSVTSAYATDLPGAPSSFKQREADFQALTQALQSGDLAGAQQAFAALQQSVPQLGRAQNASQDNSGQNPLSSDIQALGKALQQGDLSGAQSAFAKLQQDAKQAGGAHHRHHHGHGGGSAPSSTGNSTSPGTSSSIDIKA